MQLHVELLIAIFDAEINMALSFLTPIWQILKSVCR